MQHFQKDIVRGTEGFISAGSKQLEACTFLIFIDIWFFLLFIYILPVKEMLLLHACLRTSCKNFDWPTWQLKLWNFSSDHLSINTCHYAFKEVLDKWANAYFIFFLREVEEVHKGIFCFYKLGCLTTWNGRYKISWRLLQVWARRTKSYWGSCTGFQCLWKCSASDGEGARDTAPVPWNSGYSSY